MRVGHLQRGFVVKRRRYCTATDRLRLSPPYVRWHPVVAEYGDASLADVAHGFDHVVYLPLTIRAAKHDVQIEVRGDILQRRQSQAMALDHKPQLHQVVDRPFSAGIR